MVISSLIVETKPEYVSAVAQDAAALPGVEIHGTDPDTGRIVVTIEAESSDASHEVATGLTRIPHVLNVNLVYVNFEDENLNR